MSFIDEDRLESQEEVLRAALKRLLERPAGAFLIIEEVVTGRFLQYAGSSTEPLTMDLPAQTLSTIEMDRARDVFKRLGYPGLQTYETLEYPGGPPVGVQTSFLVNFDRDVERALELGLAVLKEVYGFGERVSLSLTED